METEKKTMKPVHGNVTFQCDQCNYKANKPKINYRQAKKIGVQYIVT